MLTILALYHSYSGGDDAFALTHFSKAKALSSWLIARRSLSLHYPKTDPRHGMIGGNEEGDERAQRQTSVAPGRQPEHYSGDEPRFHADRNVKAPFANVIVTQSRRSCAVTTPEFEMSTPPEFGCVPNLGSDMVAQSRRRGEGGEMGEGGGGGEGARNKSARHERGT